jgi:predicted DNA-binding transcriptional regulator AlpA
MTKPIPPIQADDRLAWRVPEFAKLVSVSAATIYKMSKAGKIRLEYFGDLPVVPRTEAIRLGLLSA